MLLTLRVFICLQFNGLLLIVGYTEERLTREGDRVSLRCDINSTAGSSVLWLYTPGKAYEGVQHIYTDGRMLSGWPSRCNVTTDAISSTLVLLSVHPKDAGYYECSDDHDDGIFIRLRVKLTVSKGITSVKTAFYSTTELSRSSIRPRTNRTTATAWDKNATLITGAPGNLPLVSGDHATGFFLANLNAFVTIGGIVLVAIFVAIMLTAMLTVAFKKTYKPVQPSQNDAETDGYAEIQTTDINSEQRQNVPGSYSSSSQEDTNSPQLYYEEIPATRSTIRADYENESDRNHQGNFNSAQDYEEIPPTTTFHAEQRNVHGIISVNDEGNGYLQHSAYLSAMNYDELSPTSLPVIFPGPLMSDHEGGVEGEYWPMVRDGYVEISRRPNVISTVVYDVLQPKKESERRKRNRLPMFRFFRREIGDE